MLDFQLLSTGQSLPPTHPLCLRAAQLGDEIQCQQQQVDHLMTESQTLDSLLMPLVNSLPLVPLQAIGSSPPTVLGNKEGEVSQILDQMEAVRNLHPSAPCLTCPHPGCTMTGCLVVAKSHAFSFPLVQFIYLSRWFTLLLCLLCLFPSLLNAPFAEGPGVVPFHALSLNANGLSNVMKCDSISHAISSSQPHAWTLLETKSVHSVAHRVRASDYITFESPGLPTTQPRSSRCGVIVGVRRTLA